mgnify:CR=1 FL=1
MKDVDIRNILRDRLLAEHESDRDALVVEELGLCEGRSRVDLAVVNGSIHGYEIKSDRDTLARLQRQCEIYARCFDAITLVVGAKHLAPASAMIPECWGLILARESDDGVTLETLRTSQRNRCVSPDVVVQLLWRDEAAGLLSSLGLAPTPRPRLRRELWRILAESVPPDELGRLVRRAIKARGDWRPAMRRARCSGSSPTVATAEHCQANLDWLLSVGSRSLPG